MEVLPTVPFVFCCILILFIVIMTVLYWCCNRKDGDDETSNELIEEDKVRCIRLQINAGSTDECLNVFEFNEDQPPPYEHPPTYRSLHLLRYPAMSPNSFTFAFQ